VLVAQISWSVVSDTVWSSSQDQDQISTFRVPARYWPAPILFVSLV